MNLDDLHIEISMEDESAERKNYLANNPEAAAKADQEEKEFIMDAIAQIRDYIKTFKQFPPRDNSFSFECVHYDSFYIEFIIIRPITNEVYCHIKF